MTPRAPYNAHCYALPQKRMAQSCRSTWYHDSAMRPVEPAIRCTYEFGTSLNSHNADKVADGSMSDLLTRNGTSEAACPVLPFNDGSG